MYKQIAVRYVGGNERFSLKEVCQDCTQRLESSIDDKVNSGESELCDFETLSRKHLNYLRNRSMR